ncbi:MULTISPECIES: hypothetical protein [Bacillales]|uniref:Uncharacterized protein n=1 Tax=Brevibacillus aydinogluensis TaxID=927786 RepID=A0AA48M7N2_9BACL|nr:MULTISPECIES: hypothetical protein [Bacillales]MBR8658295.1 hypothetical protein [Brevibacillus sp. NL20B1]MDT3414671.1 cell division protein FtsL [Brevibacillus aydinogluensis]UFJ61029.1 hypothetical protein IRT44_17575 [Anoxybacillus sediminis]CAJ1002155.1 hypothetical protein BSPP4475_07510 [Brevibacillus aydinogluensis]
MNQAEQLLAEAKRLEAEWKKVKQQLAKLQSECEHDFARGQLSMTCRKCLYTESTYY